MSDEHKVRKLLQPGEKSRERVASLLSRPDVGTALVITFNGREWCWDYHGDATVMEIVGSLEVVKADILRDYQAYDEG